MGQPYFTTREYVFAAMMAAAHLVTSSIVIPLTLPLRIPGLPGAANAPLACFILALGLVRLRKPGSLLLINGLYAAVCALISPVITTFVLLSAVVAELVCTVVFRGYRSRLAVFVGCVVQQMVMFPASLVGLLLFGASADLARALQSYLWWVVILAEAAIFVTASVGTLAGLKVAKELAAAGKLHVEEE